MAGLEAKTPHDDGGSRNISKDTTGDHGLGSLTGMDILHHAFLFLDGPADVLRAATACHRWRELACADVVWRIQVWEECQSAS